MSVPTTPTAPAIDLLETLKAGLPAPASPGRHVAIVGGGIAGLTAGLLLKEAGHRVTILEAQNRLGGRVLTYRGFAGKMYGELGAMRFPRQHHLGQHFIHDRFNLQTRAFGMEDPDTLIHINGRRVRRSDFKARDLGLDLPANERDLEPAQILKDAMAPLIELAKQPHGWLKIVDQFDGYSVLEFLLHRGVSEQALWLLGPLFNLEGRFHFSLVEWFTHWYEDVFGDLEFIEAGSSTLIDAFAAELQDDTRLGAQVRAIRQDRDGVTVEWAGSTGTRTATRADEVIVTVPFVLLRHMEIDGLDPEKRFAIRNTYYGRAHKIFMQFSRRWWQEDEGIAHGVSVTDLAIRNVVYTPAGQDPSTKKGVLIASYAWEQDSMAYSMLDEQSRIAEALEDLGKLHPQALETFEFGVSHDWSLDRWAGGIGPLFRPLEMTGRFYDDIVRPVGRVWFANDACDRRARRWIEGSIAAAIKNAWAIHAGLRDQLPSAPEA